MNPLVCVSVNDISNIEVDPVSGKVVKDNGSQLIIQLMTVNDSERTDFTITNPPPDLKIERGKSYKLTLVETTDG